MLAGVSDPLVRLLGWDWGKSTHLNTLLPNNSLIFSGEPVNGIENRLDRCSVTVSPALNPDHEQIDIPQELLKSLSIVGSVSADGADFSGAEMIYNYERLLRQVRR